MYSVYLYELRITITVENMQHERLDFLKIDQPPSPNRIRSLSFNPYPTKKGELYFQVNIFDCIFIKNWKVMIGPTHLKNPLFQSYDVNLTKRSSWSSPFPNLTI